MDARAPAVGKEGGTTFAPPAVDPHPVGSVSPSAAHSTLQEISDTSCAQWWWLTLGALVLGWVLHRAIDRVVGKALT
jgi:hypothetical protein